jgi:dynein heavy chain
MAEKRREFPRFYFLSNDELIDILANSQRIDIIQLHLKTLFDNLVRVDVEGDAIKAICSGEKEEVKLKKEVKCSGPIEQWLKKLQEEMISSLSAYMKAAQNEYPSVDRKAFVGKWPG